MSITHTASLDPAALGDRIVGIMQAAESVYRPGMSYTIRQCGGMVTGILDGEAVFVVTPSDDQGDRWDMTITKVAEVRNGHESSVLTNAFSTTVLDSVRRLLRLPEFLMDNPECLECPRDLFDRFRVPRVGEAWEDGDAVVLVAAVRGGHVAAWVATPPDEHDSAPAFTADIPGHGPMTVWPEAEVAITTGRLTHCLGPVLDDATMQRIPNETEMIANALAEPSTGSEAPYTSFAGVDNGAGTSTARWSATRRRRPCWFARAGWRGGSPTGSGRCRQPTRRTRHDESRENCDGGSVYSPHMRTHRSASNEGDNHE